MKYSNHFVYSKVAFFWQNVNLHKRLGVVSFEGVRKFVQNCSSAMARYPAGNRILCVAEKNDAAKSVAEIMSRGGFRRVSFEHLKKLG